MKALAIAIHSMAGGGAERVVIDILEELSRQEIKLYLLLEKLQGPLLSEIPDGVQVIELGSSDGIRNVFMLRRRLLKIVREKDIDGIVSNLTGLNRAFLRLSIFTRNLPPITIVEHSVLSSRLFLSGRSKLYNWLQRIEIKILYSRAHAIIGVSRGVSRDLEDIINQKTSSVSTIYNPLNTNRVEQLKEVRPEGPMPERFLQLKRPIIVSAGRLIPIKRFQDLIYAFELMPDNLQGSLVIFGNGGEISRLREIVNKKGLEDKVILAPFTKNLFWYLSRSDIFALSSEVEGFGNVLVEALACNIPVVSTETSGAKDIITNDEQGIIVPIGCPEKLCDAILMILNGKFASPRSASEDILKRISPDYICSQYLSVIFGKA